MYKIKYLITGHEFLLPDETAQELKDKFPNDYKILEKDGKKFKDKKTIIKFQDGSIRSLVMEEPLTLTLSHKGRGNTEDEPLTSIPSLKGQGNTKDEPLTKSKDFEPRSKKGWCQTYENIK